MARPRSPNRDKAFKLFKKHNGNIRNKDLAALLDEDPKTVSKWKTLDKWEKRLTITISKKQLSKKQENMTTYEEALQECSQNERVLVSIQEADELNEKQLLFCIYYSKYFNATKAYQKAYDCKTSTASVQGCKLLKQPNIQKTIQELKNNRMNRAMLSPDDIFQKYMDIAFSDITDYVSFGKRHEQDGEFNYMDFRDWQQIDGTLVKEIKLGKNGLGIKLEDRLKALDWLADHVDLATEEQKARVESLRNKVRVENENLELAKKKFEREEF